jgi:hypothetical protein
LCRFDLPGICTGVSEFWPFHRNVDRHTVGTFSLVGGMVSATILTLIIFPDIYALTKEIPIRRSLKTGKI